jgi:hypothetical protein
MELTATFALRIPEPFLCIADKRYTTQPLRGDSARFTTTVDAFGIEILFTDFSGSGAGKVGGPLAGEVTQVTIIVTGTVDEHPPTVEQAEDGTINLTPLQEYLWRYQPAYRRACETVFERLARYFRFERGNPLVRLHPDYADPGLLNPVWTDEEGQLVWGRGFAVGSDAGGGLKLYPRAHVRAYATVDRPELLTALQDPIVVPLHEELLADAKDAIADGNLRRAIIDLAVGCEVGVKQHFFAPASHADAAYSYLEDKGRVNAKITDFLDAVALRAFGESLRNENPECFRHIDHLFRARNKVAHRGTTTFRDDNGNEITPDFYLLLDWWEAAAEMLTWLRTASRTGP